MSVRMPAAVAAAALFWSVTSCADPAATAGGVARGRYMVLAMGCADCHTPRGPDGQPLPGRDLSGHPADAPLPSWEPSLLEKHGVATIAPTGTAFAGPFGVSVAPNLTPDLETGIGAMTADDLLESWRTGQHWQFARPVMPPMPTAAYANLEAADIRAIHAYLSSLPPIENAAPRSVPAAAAH